MRTRRGVVGLCVCVKSWWGGAHDWAPPPTADEPPDQQPGVPVPAQPQAAPSPPPQAPDNQTIYPRTVPAPNGPNAGTGTYPEADAEVPDDFVTRSYGTDTYVGNPRVLRITPETDPYRLSIHQKYPLKVDLLAEVPIPLTDDHDSSKVGFGISGMFGWDLGWLLPTAGIGWSWSELNLPPGFRDDNRNLKRFHLNLGLMAEFENKSIVTPVIGALVDFNWWHVSGDDSVACGGYYYWGCYEVENYHYATGFTFKAGIDVRFRRNDRFSLGTGVLPQVTLAGGPFTQAEWWISPYAVFTVRN